MLSRLVITFLPRSKHLLISWLQSPSAVILEPQKVKSVTIFTVSPSICYAVMGPDAIIFVFWMSSLKPTFSLSSFTFIKRHFQFSSVQSLICVQIFVTPWTTACQVSLFFTFCHKGGVICISEVIDISPNNLDSSCASFILAFHMMYSAYELNKQGDNIQPWSTPFPIWNQFVVPCLVLLLLDLHTGFLGGR